MLVVAERVLPDPDPLALLLESTGERLFGIDLDGRCTFMNRAACEMLGWRTNQVLGRTMHSLMYYSHSDGCAFPDRQYAVRSLNLDAAGYLNH